MSFYFCTQTGGVFWGVQTPHAVPVVASLYRAMMRPDADRARLYQMRVFFS